MMKLQLKFQILFVGIFLIAGLSGNAQKQLSLEEVITLALENNFSIREATLEVEQADFKKKSLSAIPKTDVSFLVGQYNSIERGDNNVVISQSIPFPSTFFKANTLGKAMVESKLYKKYSKENDIIYQVSETYLQLSYLQAKHKLLLREDSLFKELLNASSLRYKTGESTLLEKASIEIQQLEVANTVNQNKAEIKMYQAKLMALLNMETPIDTNLPLSILDIRFDLDTINSNGNPVLTYLDKEFQTSTKQKEYEVAKALPDLKVGFFSQTLIGDQFIDGQDVYFGADKRFTGVEVGLSIPLFFGMHRAQIKEAGTNIEIAENNLQGYRIKIKSEFEQALQEFDKNKNSLDYYQQRAIPNASLIEKQTQLAFKNGEIDYTTMLMNRNRVITIYSNYLKTILDYNLSIIRLEYLIGTPTH